MSMESKFKKGDRVRFNDRCVNYDSEVIVGDGDMGTITDISAGGYVTIELDSPEYITVQERDIQIVEPYDPKTAFLTELKGLLEKYEAAIEYHMGSNDKSDYSEYYAITVGSDRLTYDNCEGTSLTADNIMDYDKD